MQPALNNPSTEKPRPEVARYLLWEKGQLNYKLWNNIQRKIEAKFQDCLKRHTGLLFVNCTRGGGKTTWAVKKAYEYIRSPKIHIPQVFIATAFGEDLRTILIPTFQALAEDKPRDFPIEHVPSKRMYNDLKTQGKIHYRGLDLKRNSLRGNYADLVIIEECQNVKNLAYQWNYVVKQLFRHRPFPMAVFIGTPPETPDHDWVEIMNIAKMNDAYVEATLDEHDRMTAEEKAFMIKDIRPDAVRREYYCDLVIDKTRAIIPEWKTEHLTEWPRDEYYQYYQFYTFMDLGVVDQTVALFAWYDFKNAVLVIEDEFMMQGPDMTTERLAEGLLSYEKKVFEGKAPHLRISDNDNLLLLQDLAVKYKMQFSQVKKTTLEAMVNQVRIMVGAGRIKVNPRCKLLSGCLAAGIWDESRKGFNRSAIYGHYDALAALIYGVKMINTTNNPIDQRHNVNIETHYISEEFGKKSDTVTQLRKAFRLNK